MILRFSAAGWRRPIGCLTLQVIFGKRATNHRALLRGKKWPSQIRHLTHLRHPVVAKIMNESYLHMYESCHIQPTLQQTATDCNTLQHTLQDTAPHCNPLQHTAIHCNTLQHTAANCNTLQHTATHCNTLQHTATHCRTHCNTLQHTATHCNTLQHTATHCNTL